MGSTIDVLKELQAPTTPLFLIDCVLSSGATSAAPSSRRPTRLQNLAGIEPVRASPQDFLPSAPNCFR